MAAYAAVVSLMHTIHNIQHHPSPPISIDKQQLKSLTEIINLFQEFLEGYDSPFAHSDESDPLEVRIADAIHAAEDLIESYLVQNIELAAARNEQIHSKYQIQFSDGGSRSGSSYTKMKNEMMGFEEEQSQIKETSRISFYEDVQKVIEATDLIVREVREMVGEKKATVEAQRHTNASRNAGFRPSISREKKSLLVGSDDELRQLMDMLTGGNPSRQIIPVVGMGGIGKTALASAVFEYPFIKRHFHVCLWVTISQQYNTREILCELLSQFKKESKEDMSNMSEHGLGLALYQQLFERRFLIVLDDMWSIEAWEKIRSSFPDNNNRSRIVVTTRLLTLGSQLDNNNFLNMKFLDGIASWSLFLKTVFGGESCPEELEEIGRKIAENCRGLPLSIVVVGGILKKIEHAPGCWESIRENLISVVNLENEAFCLKVLKLSYNHLPAYLRPCFLYMGVFEEDRPIRVSTLIKLWASEGFLKPVSGKSLETAAKEYLSDLVDRNLILVHEFGSTGNIKYCKLHDLLRDLCWREARKEGFYKVIGQQEVRASNSQCCFVIPGRTSTEQVSDALQSMPLARSIVCDSYKDALRLGKSKLLRTLKAYDIDTLGSHGFKLEDLFGSVNLRYLAVRANGGSKFPCSVGLLWNLQTLIIFHATRLAAPDEIWKMPQLRHVVFHKGVLDLPYPQVGNTVVMENLQTLKGVRCFKRDDTSWSSILPNKALLSSVVPNIRKLRITGGQAPLLQSLTKLESCRCWGIHCMRVRAFPQSLKKLSLGSYTSHWTVNEDMLDTIGKLPHLQKLNLERASFLKWRPKTTEQCWMDWETSEGQFPSLKFLELKWCLLESWITESSSHFPCLEQIHLYGIRELKKIPLELSESVTLQSIVLEHCSELAVESAKKIADEHEELHGDQLCVRVVLLKKEKNQELQSLLMQLRLHQHHSSPPIYLNIKLVESLTESATFLEEFLDGYKSPAACTDGADPFEMRIAEAAYAAEDIIEFHVVDMVELGQSTNTSLPPIINDVLITPMKAMNDGKNLGSPLSLHQDLGIVMEDMNSIKKDAMKIKNEKTEFVKAHPSASGVSSSRSSMIMVGLDDVILEVLDKLTGGHNNRQVIPIVGMGGIGKTALAKTVFGNPFTKEHVDIRAWATVSQHYNTKEILCALLSQANKNSQEGLSNMREEELQLELHKYLSRRRFLIVLDDMWSIEAWEKIQHSFPDNNNGSRIMVTTRLSNLATQLGSSYRLKMKFLDEVSSWDLLSKSVFGEESCPLELEEIGKEIVKNCRGLPLSIVVVGGLFKKLEHTQQCWESIRKNSTSVVLNSENEDFCLRILKMSYNYLPVHLMPCFLYMGVFEEDRAIRVSTLIKLWVSEGFLKPARRKSLETAAKEYLRDLVDRNLVLVHELGSTGSIKYCKLHDLLRDLCWREAGKEGFYSVVGQYKFEVLNRQRCIVVPGSAWDHYAFRSMPLARSYLCDSTKVLPFPELRLLRTLKAYDRDAYSSHDFSFNHLFCFVNLRYLAAGVHGLSEFPSSIPLWNLETLIILHCSRVYAPDEIWKMRQLRHFEIHKGSLKLPNPPSSSGNIAILENLQTLKGVYNLDCAVVSKIIPNIKKLGVAGVVMTSNLMSLSKLESCRCRWWGVSHVKTATFPYSLKKLSLGSDSFHWEVSERILRTICALPLLQKLKLERARFQPKEWETRAEQFPSLKFLELKWCLLESWTTESSHFPRLEKLHLFGIKELEEIPSEVGEIPTLQSILLEHCSKSVVESAKNIAEEQEELHVRVVLFNDEDNNNNNNNQALRCLASPNFLDEIVDL